MTVLIYVNTNKQVGDADHLKVFANADAAETGSKRTIPRASPSNTRFLSEPLFVSSGQRWFCFYFGIDLLTPHCASTA
jgi:hypothetical protein